MAAVSRSVYIIFLGSLALILNAALKTDLSVLCVYGYNIDSRAVLMFVRNGLLSECVCVCVCVCVYVYVCVCLSVAVRAMWFLLSTILFICTCVWE